MKKCSMQKKIESLKKNEDSARPYMNRLYCLVEQGYIDWATIGEYLARGLSEDMVEKAYGWMKQDELIPTDDALEGDGLEWDEDGELVSIENDESKKQEYRVKPLQDSVDALVKQGFDKGLLHDIILELVDMGCTKDFITRQFDNLLDGDFLGFCVKKKLTPYQIALKLSNMGA